MQQSSAANIKRREKDVMRLMMSGKFQVHLPNEDSTQEFEVLIAGPEDSPYHGGLWCVKVQLPDMYPYKSPSIGFKNRIYHPNIDEASGSVCLDVINQTWSPMYDLINIFDIFIPQLLLYPNPTDPLNPEAAQMQMRYESKYKEKVIEYVQKFAQKEQVEKNFGGAAVQAAKSNGAAKECAKNGTADKKAAANDNLSETSLNNDQGGASDIDDADCEDVEDVDDDDEDGEDDEDMEQEQEPEELKEKELEQLKAEKDGASSKQEDQKSEDGKIEMVAAQKLEKISSSNGHSVEASKAHLNGNSSEAASAKE